MEEQSSRAKYTISVAAELAGVHPQTLRDYEKKGLLDPHRTAGNTRQYSDADLLIVRRIQTLIAAGVNLAGVELIVRLQDDLEELQGRYDHLAVEVRTKPRRRRGRG
jgi:MerR family transcriptional regulator/heat shock protein HspR